MIRVCFVCLGNICRSPTAEAIMLGLVREAGLSDAIEVDSAGTSSYHVGERADPRARAVAKKAGVEVSGSARQFEVTDFSRFDYVLAMDQANFDDLERLLPDGDYRGRLSLLRRFDSLSSAGASVPDPYYGGEEGFREVLEVCEAACRGLLEHIRAEHGL